MRILHVDPDDIENPMSGGGPVRTFEIYRRLAQRHEVTVLTPTFPGSTPEKVRDGVRYIRLGRRVLNRGSSHHFTFMAAAPGAIKQHAHDLLVEDFMPPCSATLLPFFSRQPMVASVQWFMAGEWQHKYKLPFTWGERLGVRLYQQFVVLTESMRQKIQGYHPQANCRVIGAGVDDSLFDIPLRSGDFIFFLGRLDIYAKGLDLLLDAYERLSPNERLPLVVAGSGVDDAAFREQVRRRGLSDAVRMVGKINAAQRAEMFERCRFMVMPSRWETYGMVLLEACAAGVPVVCFDHAPMNEVVPREHCKVVPHENVEALAESMAALVREPDAQLLERGRACRAFARERGSWDAVALAQERFYQESLNASVLQRA